jgi:hypothetical protein
MGYQYALHPHKIMLLEEKSELRRSQESNSASSRPHWVEYSETSESRKERHHEPKNNRKRTEWPRKEERTRSINTSLSYEEEDFIQETPESDLVAANTLQTYL